MFFGKFTWPTRQATYCPSKPSQVPTKNKIWLKRGCPTLGLGEEKLVEATNRMNVQTNPGRGKSPRSSDGSTPQPKPKVALASETPEADRMDS